MRIKVYPVNQKELGIMGQSHKKGDAREKKRDIKVIMCFWFRLIFANILQIALQRKNINISVGTGL